jgi:DNA-binding NtrC family response regulator
MSKARILVVDDASQARAALSELLRVEGYAVETAADGFKALGKLADFAPDVVLTDLKMPGMDGIELLRKIRSQDVDVCVLIMTGFASVDSAVTAMKDGAADYLTKPLDLAELTGVLKHELEQLRLRRHTRTVGPARSRSRAPEGVGRLPELVGDSPAMQQVAATVVQVAGARSSVLVTGESGTGKDLIATAIHTRSPRADGPFVRLSCEGWGEAALEAALFGVAPTARARAGTPEPPGRADGKLRQADGGTLFLDEIAAVPLPLQARLLGFLEAGTFERVGGTEPQRADVRVLAASRHDLKAEAATGRFREDLYYRLSVFSLHLPPLRERPEDVGPLCRHLLGRLLGLVHGKSITGFSSDALLVLAAHAWPGNVGELENVIERAVVLCDGPWILPRHLPPEVRSPTPRDGVTIPGTTLEEIERYAITKTLEATGGSTSEAAEVLGISARKIQYKMHEYRSAPKAPMAVVRLPPSAPPSK